jgi:hypothetical protein
MDPGLIPLHFYDQPIEVSFIVPLVRRKVPPCPDAFTWEERDWRVEEKLAEWFDFSRRGRMEKNMKPTHTLVAAGRGSLGVGRFYFRVRASLYKRTHADRDEPVSRIFDIYYDRQVVNVDDRLGHWYIYREMGPIRSPTPVFRVVPPEKK